MKLSNKNRLNLKAVAYMLLFAFFALSFFELFPVMFKYAFGDFLKPYIKYIAAILSFGMLLYGAEIAKKYLDSTNNIR
jgi:hypothetical protein